MKNCTLIIDKANVWTVTLLYIEVGISVNTDKMALKSTDQFACLNCIKYKKMQGGGMEKKKKKKDYCLI